MKVRERLWWYWRWHHARRVAKRRCREIIAAFTALTASFRRAIAVAKAFSDELDKLPPEES